MTESGMLRGRGRRQSPEKQNTMELRRQYFGWIGSLMDAGFSEQNAKRIARAVTFGPLLTVLIAQLVGNSN